jgi:HEAT repeat protein
MAYRRRKLSRFAAAASLALGTGAGALFSPLPAEVLAEWVEDEFEQQGETPLRAVSMADRAVVHAQATAASLWLGARLDGETFIKRLARDESAAVRIGAAAALGRILDLAPPLERIELTCRWTLSEEARERTAIARALALPTPVFVADLAITTLAHDPVAEVRAAVVRAVKSHFHEDPQGFARVANKLAKDRDLAVRRTAADVLSRMTG